MDTLWRSYGAAHERPVLALPPRVGEFHVDLDVFKVGMVVHCKYLDAKGRSCGWFPGVINRILNDKQLADIDYDDGTYDYGVPFKRLRIRSDHTSRTFNVAHIPAPSAIVLSIRHAREAVVRAMQLIETINPDDKSNQDEHAAFSTPSHSRSSTPPAVFTFHTSSCITHSRSSTPPAVLTFHTSSCITEDTDDEVEFVMERIGSSRGSANRPIVL